MNKKVVVTGLLVFWTGIAAYMGMRILESYAEDAVQASLSAIPAKVEEIKFSLLDKSLKLKGLSFEIPDEKIQRKGAIDEIEVKGFNRKILYVLPKTEAYTPESLPKVADAVSVKGFSETSHMGYQIVTRRIGNVNIVNWYQRLGLVFDQYSRYGVGEKFFEELFRCRMDELSFTTAEMSIKPDASSLPFTFRMAEGSVPGGVRPPKAGTLVSPISLRLKDMTFTGADFTGVLDAFEVRDVLPPEPKEFAQLMEYIRANAENADDDDMERFKEILAPAYKDSLPLASVSLSGGTFKKGDISVRAGSAFFSNTRNSGVETYVLKVKALHIPVEAMNGYADTVKRFAPNGVELSLDATNRYDGAMMSGTAEYILNDLGKLHVTGELAGDVNVLQFISPEDMLVDAQAVLSQVAVKKFSLDYEDQGLLPLSFALLADGNGELFGYVIFLLKQQIDAIRGNGGVFCSKLADTLEEQLKAPGTVHFSFEAEKPIPLLRLGMSLCTEGAEFPVTLFSTPGSKALDSYPILRN